MGTWVRTKRARRKGEEVAREKPYLRLSAVFQVDLPVETESGLHSCTRTLHVDDLIQRLDRRLGLGLLPSRRFCQELSEPSNPGVRRYDSQALM